MSVMPLFVHQSLANFNRRIRLSAKLISKGPELKGGLCFFQLTDLLN